MGFGAGLGAFLGGVAQGAQSYANIQDLQSRSKLRDMQTETIKMQHEDGKRLRQLGEQASADTAANTDGTVEQMSQYWNQKFAPKYYQEYLKTGDIEKANAFKNFSENQNVQQGLKYGTSFLRAVQMGDVDVARESMVKMFNQPGYFENGFTAVDSKTVKDKDGNVTGMEIQLKNDKTGEVTPFSFKSLEDAAKMVMPFTDPKNVFEHAMSQIKASTTAKADAAKEQREWDRKVAEKGLDQQYNLERDANKSLLNQAEEAAKNRDGKNSTVIRDAKAKEEFLRSRGVPEDRIRQLATQMVGLENQGVPVTKRLDEYIKDRDENLLAPDHKEWQQLTTEQKTEKAIKDLQARDKGASEYYGKQNDVSAGLPDDQAKQPKMIMGYDTKTGKPVMIPVK